MVYKKAIFYWFIVVLWCGVIFYFSSLPSLRIAYGIWDLILRKIAHVAEFAILTFWFFQALSVSINQSQTSKTKKALIWAMIFSFLYAISDEIHQGFVRDRYPSVTDLGIDSLGIILMGWYLAKRKC